MTSAEAIRELRPLIGWTMEGGGVPGDLEQMLATVAEIAREGADPVIELRIRRFRRRAAMPGSPPA
jgi:hypothetical protein